MRLRRACPCYCCSKSGDGADRRRLEGFWQERLAGEAAVLLEAKTLLMDVFHNARRCTVLIILSKLQCSRVLCWAQGLEAAVCKQGTQGFFVGRR